MVWFIYPDSAETCLAFAKDNKLIIDSAVISFKAYDSVLSNSPPSFDVADAPNHGFSNTINIKGVQRNTKMITKDFQGFGMSPSRCG